MDFYQRLTPFTRFEDITDAAHYIDVPDDWVVIVADIQGSTQAIEAGRYKDVNMIGAASIMAVLNAIDGLDIPYVFGGDGATLLIPAEYLSVADAALAALQSLASNEFAMTLRVGRVPVSAIYGEGAKLQVAKYELSPNNYLAALAGKGVSLVEYWIKNTSEYELKAEANAEDADLSGLSCRWQALPARNGVVLSLLVEAVDDNVEVYERVIRQAAAVMSADDHQGAPISPANMLFSWPPQGAKTEVTLTRGRRKRLFWALRCYGQMLLQFVLDRYKISVSGFNPVRYRKELQANSDYRRFDGMLRLLFDCTVEQADSIVTDLAQMQQQGLLRYGQHRTVQSLMTCVVFDLSQSRHVHFLDGDDGGFAMAAKQLKAVPLRE